MTITEQSLAPVSGLESTIAPGARLAIARDELKGFLRLPKQTEEGFTANMATYLNALQAFYFENDITTRYRIIDKASLFVKTEVECLLDYSIEPAESVQQRLDAYLADPTALELKDQMIPTYPRAFTMTLLDLVDEYRG